MVDSVSETPQPESIIELTKPHMDPESFQHFDGLLNKASVYLEYGSGGSTVYAARKPNISRIISIESDAKWVDNVRHNLAGDNDKVALLYGDIGPVVDWGRARDRSGIDRYHLYATQPWDQARAMGVDPDLIMVDGRFRVACFLYSLVCARDGATIVLDDYVGRDQYKVVEDFCPLAGLAQRMAVFTVQKTYDLPQLLKQFAKYSLLGD